MSNPLLDESGAAAKPARRDIDALCYRRQFVLAPRALADFPGWREGAVARGYRLYTHPELNVVQIRRGPLELTLLGFLIDALHPGLDDEPILQNLAEQARSLDQLPRLTASLGGRWVLIADDGSETIAFADPCGLRQAFHTHQLSRQTWLASNPYHLAKALELTPCPRAMAEFLCLPAIRADSEYWFPVPGSPYRELRRLPANHYLDLATRRVHRFWPWRPLGRRTLEEAAEEASILLRNLLRGGARRFPLTIALTAGMDSRTVLAAARGLPDVRTCTHTYWGMTPKYPDVDLPRRLARGCGLRHARVSCPTRAEPGWLRLHMRHVAGAHAAYAPITLGIYRGGPPGRVLVAGACSEIARTAFRWSGRSRPADLNQIAVESHMETSPYAREILADWLREARRVQAQYGMDIFDLLYWEQRLAGWQATAQAEYDLVQETFTPFNCRQLLEAMLEAPVEYRLYPDWVLHREMIRRLWPELLREPFNPQPPGERLRGRLAALLREANLRPLARRLSRWRREALQWALPRPQKEDRD